MKKKFIIGLSALATLGAVVAGGLATYAFLTDLEKDENVFTIGNVDVELLSSDEVKGEIHLMPNNTDKIKADYQIKNVGNEDAYVWLRVKVPAELEDEPGLAANNIIHWNYLGAYMKGYQNTQRYIDSAKAQGYPAPVAEAYTWNHLDAKHDVDGYNVYDILYNSAIKPDEETTVGVSTIFLDERVDVINGQYVLVDNGEIIKVINWDFANPVGNMIVEAHAIQANGFDTVEEAYAAYVDQYPNGKITIDSQN